MTGLLQAQPSLARPCALRLQQAEQAAACFCRSSCFSSELRAMPYKDRSDNEVLQAERRLHPWSSKVYNGTCLCNGLQHGIFGAERLRHPSEALPKRRSCPRPRTCQLAPRRQKSHRFIVAISALCLVCWTTFVVPVQISLSEQLDPPTGRTTCFEV